MKTKLNFSQSLITGLKAGLFASIVNVILFFIFHSAQIITDSVLIDGKVPLAFYHIIISSIVPLLVGSVLFFLFEKFTKNGFKYFCILALVFLVYSFTSPFSIPGITTAYAMVLNVMHVVVAGAFLFLLIRKVRSLN